VQSSRIARRINPALYQRPFRIELARLDQFSSRSQATESAYEWTRTPPLAWLLLMALRRHDQARLRCPLPRVMRTSSVGGFMGTCPRGAACATSRAAESWVMADRIRIVRHEGVPLCGSFEVRFPDGRPSRYFSLDDIAGRRPRPDLVDSATARDEAQSFANSSPRGTQRLPYSAPPPAMHTPTPVFPAPLCDSGATRPCSGACWKCNSQDE
jgi:hypothetical protein